MIERITMAHGSGSGLHALLEAVVLPHLSTGHSSVLEDAALVDVGSGSMALTTDSFVVQPLEFTGGDIGKLAACGTINDLAVMGAVPRYMSVSLILEEGLDTALLCRVLRSLRDVCVTCGVDICCGDTKVINHAKGDGLYINTTGIGAVKKGVALSAGHARPGDAVIISGDIGRHGVAVLSCRQNLGFDSSAVSDCAPLNELCSALLEVVPETRAIRDATRGGCAAILNEIAEASSVSMILEGPVLPVSDTVRHACAFLGMDPLQVANEGTFVAVVPAESAQQAVVALRKFEQGKNAAAIGMVREPGRFPVLMTTEIGGTRPVTVPPGELLPRIC
jgi:hydrogenase expression/formation protein HypE